MAIYKRVLHHSDNTVPKWFLETLGVWVSILNDCPYCVNHHAKGMERLIDDHGRAQEVLRALKNQNVDDVVFTEAESRALRYAEILTRTPGEVTRQHVIGLVDAGYTDGEILEINQVVAYFNYANRTVLGLGVAIEGDIVGLSPGNSDDPSDWSHK